MDPSFTQDINFKGSQVEFSVGIIAQDVRIKCSAGDHDHGSSKMKLTDMVDFNWGLRVCPGHLIAIHRTGQYIAYGLKTREHGMVRVLNTVTKEKTLIKGVRGLIYDIAFAFCTQEILLSFVDEEGTLYVYEIIPDEAASNTELKHKLVVQLCIPQSRASSTSVRSNNESSGSSSSSSRVTWCPYVPSYGEDEASCAEHSKLLVLLRMGGSAEVVDVGVLARADTGGVFADDRPADGYVRLDECHSTVVDASFSPDGTALATAGQDGYVKFFQVFLRDGERPRCLHEWRPHDGKALSSLLFLDNINTYGTDCKFWKFAVTGALNNSELKVWSCETWTCTQTIVFHADPRASSPDLYLKARLDDTGTYLILTETNNRLLYVLQVRRDDDVQHAAIENVAEFLLPAACISFCVRTATLGSADIDATLLYGMDGDGRKKQPHQRRCGYLTVDQISIDDDSDLLDEDLLDDDYRDMSVSDDVHIHMYLMQTKCLQECRLVFRPEIITTDDTITSPITNKPSLSVDLKLDDLQTSVQQLIIKQQQQQQQQEFSADDEEPNNFASDVDVAPATAVVANGDNSNILLFVGEKNVDVDNSTEVAVDNNAAVDKVVVVVDDLIDIDLATSGSTSVISNPSNSQVVERNFASGGSSPSREVQEILLSLSVSSSSSQSHQQQHISNTNNPAATTSTSLPNNAATTAAATYTPKQFFDSLTKLQQHKDCSVIAGQDWSDIPKVSNVKLVQLNQEQQHSNVEVRLEALENTLRLHTAKLSAERQQLLSNKNTDEIIAALALQDQRITALLEQQRHSLEATVQAAIATAVTTVQQAAQAKPVTPAVAMIDSTALSTAVQQELKCAIVPLVQATFDQLHRSLDAQHAQKLCHLENLLRSNVQRLFSQCSQNKALTEALNGALVQMIRPGLEAQYRDFMATSLVPAWEKVCEAMFQQIHATFTQGTQEYCGAMERYCLEQQRQQQLVQQQVDVSGQQMQAQVSCAFNRLEVALAEVVRDEVRTGLKQLQKFNSTLNRSSGDYNDGGSDAGGKRAPTPGVQHLQQQQQQVKRLLNRGGRSAICEAFQVALSAAAAASDTALVLYVCERVPVHEVFCSPAADPSTRVEGCILPQHVLLSLIQQLSADLTQHTDLKHRYLEESLLNLDMKSSVTKEHGPLVLRDLLKQLAAFLAAYPTHASTRSMRMLHMVTQSYVLSSAADLT